MPGAGGGVVIMNIVICWQPPRPQQAACRYIDNTQQTSSIELQNNLREDFTITEKAPTRAIPGRKCLLALSLLRHDTMVTLMQRKVIRDGRVC